MKMKKLLMIIVLCVIPLNTACTYKEQFEKSESSLGNRDERDLHYGTKAYGLQANVIDHHQIKEMKLNLSIANEITKMDGIRGSYVMLTDRNAYVAIVTDNAATGTNGVGRAREKPLPTQEEEGHELGNSTPYGTPPYYISDAMRIYTISDPKNISSKLKQNIAERVRVLNPQVQEVFISANAEFNNLLHSYAQQSWLGNSLDPYVEEFEKVVNDHFTE
jgi:YhcN/YlaJ family sporulation lipoprotein